MAKYMLIMRGTDESYANLEKADFNEVLGWKAGVLIQDKLPVNSRVKEKHLKYGTVLRRFEGAHGILKREERSTNVEEALG